MFLYLGILVLLLASIFAPKNNKILFFISCFILFALAAMQHWNVGRDSLMYYDVFQGTQKAPFDEPLWSFIAQIAYYFHGNYYVFQSLFYLAVLVPIFYVIYKKSEHYQLSLFLFYAFFYYLNSFCIMRQSLAISMAVLCYYFLFEKKYIKAFAFYFLAVLAHKSAIITIVPVIFIFYRFSYKQILLILVSTFIIGLVLPIQKLGIFFGSYKKYINMVDHGIRTNQYIFSATFAVLNIIFLFFIRFDTEKNQKSASSSIVLLGFVVMNLSQQLVMALRVTQYFLIAQILYYTANIIAKDKNKTKWLLALLFFACIYFFGLLYRDSIGVIPYKTLFYTKSI
ncbi:MAG: hypothetical protein BKP49_07790 [Treponema sp. CETP13]|nr:MAG: hypothetical protein BKP49_07790 [Treponema sp. CETP13]